MLCAHLQSRLWPSWHNREFDHSNGDTLWTELPLIVGFNWSLHSVWLLDGIASFIAICWFVWPTQNEYTIFVMHDFVNVDFPWRHDFQRHLLGCLFSLLLGRCCRHSTDRCYDLLCNRAFNCVNGASLYMCFFFCWVGHIHHDWRLLLLFEKCLRLLPIHIYISDSFFGFLHHVGERNASFPIWKTVIPRICWTYSVNG